MRTYTVITVNPLSRCGRDEPAGTLYQYDYGQRLVFGGVDLPQAYEVHFSNTRGGESLTVIGDATGVDIPDELLLTGQDVHVWLYLHQGETDGETVYYARIAVKTRAKPTHETPTPVQQDEITQVIAALGSAVDHVDDIAEAMPGEIRDALQEAKDSGEFDGPPGPQGEKGDKGDAGADGISPAASVSKSGGVATITVTDADGTTTAEIYDGADGKDGKDGKDGADGADGFSPSASVSKSGSTATITITDRTGTTTASVQDGADGADGQDGYTPVRGTDYWTAADQAQILEDVEDALIDDTAAAGDVTKVWSADKSSSEVTALKSAIDGKAPVILRSASGDIVNISDGADGIPLSSCVVSIDPVQSGTGDPAPDNIRPISGWTGANIYRWGHNAAAPMVIGVAISSTDGHETTASDKATTPFIPVDFDQYPTYLFSGFTDRLRTFIAAYNAKKEFRGRTNAITATEKAITKDYFINAVSNSGPIAYVRLIQYENVNLPGTISEVANLTVQLEPGAAATAYQPYQGQTYAVDWQTAAGTVYGGTLDTVNGVLTVTDGQIASYAGETLPGAWISDRDVYTPGGTPTTGAQVVYKLATPQTVQLSAVEIKALLGENNLWADTGAISLTYPADTQTYVDSAITAATDPDGNVVQVTGTTPSITGESGKRYVCGTVDSISITPPQTGIIDVVFTSGTTPTVLTASGVVWPGWFDPNSLSASTVYDITIKDGYGVVNTWS